jgi:hypothetical protein
MGSRDKGEDHRVDAAMAKDKKKSADKRAASRGDAVRGAVDQAFQATAGQAETARVGAQAIVDEFAQAAGRVREVLEDLRPPSTDELDELRRTVKALEQRVAALETAQAKPKRAPARAKKPAATKTADKGATGRS